MVKDLDILHCHRSGIVPDLIRFFTKSRFSHTAMVIEIEGNLFVIDAQAKGPDMRPLHIWQKKYGYKYAVSRSPGLISENDKVLIKRRALSLIADVGYDYKALLFDHPWYILTGKWRGRTKAEALNRIYCSELIGYAFQFSHWWKRSPQSIFCLCHCSNSFQTYNENWALISVYGQCNNCEIPLK